jgi:hypothetical protein
MSKKPYPGYPPNYRVVDETGGYYRTCLVIELLSIGSLSNTEMALVQERLEATVEQLKRDLRATIEASQLVTPDRFDPLLRDGLRLSK